MLVMSLFFACGPNGEDDPNNPSTDTVAKPTITPNGGEITTEDTVTLATTTTDAKIFYTTDGADPTNTSTEYTAPFKLAEGEAVVVKAIAYKGEDKSKVAEATFKVTAPQVANDIAVVCTSADDPIVAGSVLNVKITSDNVASVDVYQIEEGKDPASLGTVDVPFDGTLEVVGKMLGTYKLRAYKAGENVTSSTLYGESEPFEVKLAKPTTTNVAEVRVDEKISLATTVTIDGVEIHYSLDGSDPTTKYEGEFEHGKAIGDTFTVKAKTVVGGDSSDPFEMAFTVVDADVLLSEDFQDKEDLSAYTIVNNELIQDTAGEWKIKALGNGSKYASCNVSSGNFKNDSRLELGEFDLSTYTGANISFDFGAMYTYYVQTGTGGEHVEEGGMDLKLVVKDGEGEWTMLWHEADTLPENVDNAKATVDLSAYVGAGHTAVKVAFWVIGLDGAWTTVDNIKLIGIK